MSRWQRFWRWWTAPAGKRFHVVPAYVLLAVALTAGVATLHHIDQHYRSESCELGQENDVAIRESLELVAATMNRIILAAQGSPTSPTPGAATTTISPRRAAINDSLADLDAAIARLAVRQCGRGGIIAPTTSTETSTTSPTRQP